MIALSLVVFYFFQLLVPDWKSPSLCWTCHHGRRKAGAGEGLTPLNFEIWHFPVKFFSKNGCFLSFERAKWNFTTFSLGKIFWVLSEKSTIGPPPENIHPPPVRAIATLLAVKRHRAFLWMKRNSHRTRCLFLPSPAPSFAQSTSAPNRSSSVDPPTQVDESKEKTTVQIRLSDGTRLRQEFNHTHRCLSRALFFTLWLYAGEVTRTSLESLFSFFLELCCLLCKKKKWSQNFPKASQTWNRKTWQFHFANTGFRGQGKK